MPPAIVVTAVNAPAHHRSIEYQGTDFGIAAGIETDRPIFIP